MIGGKREGLFEASKEGNQEQTTFSFALMACGEMGGVDHSRALREVPAGNADGVFLRKSPLLGPPHVEALRESEQGNAPCCPAGSRFWMGSEVKRRTVRLAGSPLFHRSFVPSSRSSPDSR